MKINQTTPAIPFRDEDYNDRIYHQYAVMDEAERLVFERVLNNPVIRMAVGIHFCDELHHLKASWPSGLEITEDTTVATIDGNGKCEMHDPLPNVSPLNTGENEELDYDTVRNVEPAEDSSSILSKGRETIHRLWGSGIFR
jgi:hypothetical protein